jgi:short-subunit dehydrogenase
VALPYVSSYSASKFALVGLTEALRREYKGTGVTFTAFCPGNVDTPMIAESMKNKRFTKLVKPMTAKKAALIIMDCCFLLTPEKIVGEIPSIVARTSKFFPLTVDYMICWIYRRIHPIARARLLKK